MRTTIFDKHGFNIIKLYKTTKNNSINIAENYNCSVSTVCNILRNNLEKTEYKKIKSIKYSEARKRKL